MIYVFESFYQILMQFLPEKFQFNDTENNKDIAKMFTHGWLVPFLFLDIVILTPFVEELIFRHLIIHELGKKFNLLVMMIVSVLIETIVQVYDLISILEAIPYMIISIGAVMVYMKSGKNLAASYLYHSTVQLIIFIITMIDKLV